MKSLLVCALAMTLNACNMVSVKNAHNSDAYGVKASSDEMDMHKRRLCRDQSSIGLGYQFARDVDRFATVREAECILLDNGSVFFSEADVAQSLGIPLRVRLPSILPFTVRELKACNHCVLFPTFSAISYRNMPTSIENMIRAPETRRKFASMHNRRNPWFQGLSFSEEPLRDEWHLMHLTFRPTPLMDQLLLNDNEKLAKANVYFWMLMILPPEKFVGKFFYTAEFLHKRKTEQVFVGRVIPRDIFVTRILAGTAGILPEVIPSSR